MKDDWIPFDQLAQRRSYDFLKERALPGWWSESGWNREKSPTLKEKAGGIVHLHLPSIFGETRDHVVSLPFPDEQAVFWIGGRPHAMIFRVSTDDQPPETARDPSIWKIVVYHHYLLAALNKLADSVEELKKESHYRLMYRINRRFAQLRGRSSSLFRPISSGVFPLADLAVLTTISLNHVGKAIPESVDPTFFPIRNLHPHDFGLICPLQTPHQGRNTGMIVHPAHNARIELNTGHLGLDPLSPFQSELPVAMTSLSDREPGRRVELSSPSTPASFMPFEPQAVSPIDSPAETNELTVLPSWAEEIKTISETQSPDCFLSVPSRLLPFLEHAFPSRAVQATNLLAQVVPIEGMETPLIRTGAEKEICSRLLKSAPAPFEGEIQAIDRKISFAKSSNQNHGNIKWTFTCREGSNHSYSFPLQHKNTPPPLVATVGEGQYVAKGQPLLDTPWIDDDGSYRYGRNLRVVYLPWKGCVSEDGIVVSRSLVTSGVLNTPRIHIEVHQMARYSLSGRSEIRVRVGDILEEGQLLVSGTTPGLVYEGPPGRLLHVETFPKNCQTLSTCLTLRLVVLSQRLLECGDKLTGRHGNKGVVSRIEADEQMPILTDGQPAEMILNPFGVHKRMSLGQLFETILGLKARLMHGPIVCPPFSRGGWNSVRDFMADEDFAEDVLHLDQQQMLRWKEEGVLPVRIPGHETVYACAGVQYFSRLHHLAAEKISVREAGRAFSLRTAQPSNPPRGMRLGEMEGWALQVNGFPERALLREFMLLASDSDKPAQSLVHQRLSGLASSGSFIALRSVGDLIHLIRMIGLEIDFQNRNEPHRNGEIVTANGKVLDASQDGGKENVPDRNLPRVVIHLTASEPDRPELVEFLKEQNGILPEKGGFFRLKAENGECRSVGYFIRCFFEALDRDGRLKGLHRLPAWLITQLDRMEQLYIPPLQTRERIGTSEYTDEPLLDLLLRPIGKPEFSFSDVALGRILLTIYTGAATGRGLLSSQLSAYRGLLSLFKGGKRSYIRQFLLGKRVNSTGRAVLAPGPNLNLDAASIPASVLIPLLRPLLREHLATFKADGRQCLIDMFFGRRRAFSDEELQTLTRWILEQDIRVMLLRPPCLHRHSVMSFSPVPMNENVIRINPLTITGFSADFDGDTMIVFLPLTREAQRELQFMTPSKQLHQQRRHAWNLFLEQEIMLAWPEGSITEPPSTLNRMFEAGGDSAVTRFLNEKVIPAVTELKPGAESASPELGLMLRDTLETQSCRRGFYAGLNRGGDQPWAKRIYSGGSPNEVSLYGRQIGIRTFQPLALGMPPEEFFLSAYDARVTIMDKGLNTAPAGYLTRQLVEKLYNLRVATTDCGADFLSPAVSLLRGESDRGQTRSPLSCNCKDGLCQMCIGENPMTGLYFPIGFPIGIVAGQTVGERGTQLSMKAFSQGQSFGLNDMRRVLNMNFGFLPSIPWGKELGIDSGKIQPLCGLIQQLAQAGVPARWVEIILSGILRSPNRRLRFNPGEEGGNRFMERISYESFLRHMIKLPRGQEFALGGLKAVFSGANIPATSEEDDETKA